MHLFKQICPFNLGTKQDHGQLQNWFMAWCWEILYRKGTSIRQAPVEFALSTSEHYGQNGACMEIYCMDEWHYNYTCMLLLSWFPTSINVLILPSQFWQIRFIESCILIALFKVPNTGAFIRTGYSNQFQFALYLSSITIGAINNRTLNWNIIIL